jgi:phage/plasmid-associated DNA primase
VANPAREAALHDDAELQGLLVLAVRGMTRLLERGYFELPASVEEATAAFRRSADQVRGFLDDWLPTLAAEWVPRTEVYRAYEQWASANGHQSLSAGSFYERLETASYDLTTHAVAPRIRQGTRGYRFVSKAVLHGAFDGAQGAEA